MLKFIPVFLYLILSHPVYAFTCYITMMKDSCWGNYNVTVNIIDSINGKIMATVVVPEGSYWQRAKFECTPGQNLQFQASFTPVFWKQDTGKVYTGISSWALPTAISSGDTAWNINLCYPQQFGEVPFPPEGTNKCACSMAGIPPIKPQ